METDNTRRKRFLRRVRRQRLKYISVLPSMITLINGLCGFAAITFAGKGVIEIEGITSLKYFAISGYLIFVAMVADVLDGRVARMSQSTSSFGGQLDSLCDVISFGVAPAYLMLKLLSYQLEQLNLNPFLNTFLIRFLWLSAGVFMACAAVRLARFNVENEEDETSHMSFLGLPTPAAAGVIASIIVFYQDLLPVLAEKNSTVYWFVENLIVYCLPFVGLCTAILMVSRVRYPHIVNQYLRGKKPIAYLFWGIGLLVVFCWNPQLMLFIGFCSFALLGFGRYVYYKVIAKNSPEAKLFTEDDSAELMP